MMRGTRVAARRALSLSATALRAHCSDHHARFRCFVQAPQDCETLSPAHAVDARASAVAAAPASRDGPADWQRALRRQFGEQQAFTLTALGDAELFGDWSVGNPASGTTYRVSVRGLQPGDNFCQCADLATNGLGTCKHIEFALHRLQKKRGARSAFARGYQPPFSEIWLQYGEQRSLRFSAGESCPDALRQWAARHFSAVDGTLCWRHGDVAPSTRSRARRCAWLWRPGTN